MRSYQSVRGSSDPEGRRDKCLDSEESLLSLESTGDSSDSEESLPVVMGYRPDVDGLRAEL